MDSDPESGAARTRPIKRRERTPPKNSVLPSDLVRDRREESANKKAAEPDLLPGSPNDFKLGSRAISQDAKPPPSQQKIVEKMDPDPQSDATSSRSRRKPDRSPSPETRHVFPSFSGRCKTRLNIIARAQHGPFPASEVANMLSDPHSGATSFQSRRKPDRSPSPETYDVFPKYGDRCHKTRLDTIATAQAGPLPASKQKIVEKMNPDPQSDATSFRSRRKPDRNPSPETHDIVFPEYDERRRTRFNIIARAQHGPFPASEIAQSGTWISRRRRGISPSPASRSPPAGRSPSPAGRSPSPSDNMTVQEWREDLTNRMFARPDLFPTYKSGFYNSHPEFVAKTVTSPWDGPPSSSETLVDEETALGKKETKEPALAKTETTEPALAKKEPTEPALAKKETIEPALAKKETIEPALAKKETTEPTLAKKETKEPTLAKKETIEPALAKKEMTESALTKKETTEPALVKKETKEPALAKRETKEPALAKKETIEPALAKKETTEPALAKKETAEPALAKKETKEPALAKKETIEPALAKKETTEPALVKKETKEPALAKKETKKPDLAKKETIEPALVKKETKEPALAKKETIEPVLAKKETTEPALVKKETKEPALAKRETTEPALVKKETIEPALAKKETAEPALAKKETKEPALAQKETTEPALVKKETKEPALAKRETTEPALAKKETTAPALAKKEIEDPALAKKETVEPALAKKETRAPALAKKEIKEPALAKKETIEPALVKKETKEPALAKKETTEPALAKKETKEPALAKRETTGPALAKKETTAPALAKKEIKEPALAKKETIEPALAKKETTEPALVKKETEKSEAVNNEKDALDKQESTTAVEETTLSTHEESVPLEEGKKKLRTKKKRIRNKRTQTTWSGCGLFHMVRTSYGLKYHMFAEETKGGVKYNECGKPSRDEGTQTKSDDGNADEAKQGEAEINNSDEEKKTKRAPCVSVCFANRDEHSKKLHKEMRKKLQAIQIDPKMPKTLAPNHFERAMKIINLPVAGSDDDDSESEDSEDEMDNNLDGKVRTKEYFDWPNSLLTTTLTTVAEALQKIDCQCQESAQRSPNESSGRDDTLKKVLVVKSEGQDGISDQVLHFEIPDNDVLDNVTLKISRGAGGNKSTFKIEGTLNDRTEEDRRVATAWRAIAKAKLLKYKRKLSCPDKYFVYGGDCMPPPEQCCSKHGKDNEDDDDDRHELAAEIEEASKDLDEAGPSRKSSSSSEGSGWVKIDESEKSA